MRRLAARAMVYGLLAVAITWPTAVHPVASMPGSSRTDLHNSLWSLWYAAQRLAGDALPTRVDGLLNHPDGGSLFPADPVNALLAAPVVLAASPAAAWSVLVIAHLAFGAFAADALARRLGGSGWLAGVGYGFGALALAHVRNGASEAVGLGWLPVAALMVLRVGEPGVWPVVRAVAALATCAVAHWYAGVCAFLLAILLAVGRDWRRVVLATGLASALVLPVAFATARWASEADSVVGIKSAKELATVRRTIGPADPVAFLMPGDYRSPDFRELSRYGEEYVHSPYLGWTLVVLALAGLRRPSGSGRWWAAGLIGAGLACGPVLARFGSPVVLDGNLAIPLPYLLLEPLPLFGSLSLLWRLAQLPAIALAVLADRSAGRLGSPLAAVALLETTLLSPMAGGLPHADGVPSPPIVALATLPEGAVMNFPVVGGRGYLYEQTIHHHPLTGGLNFPNNAASRRVWKAILDADRDDAAAVAAAATEAARTTGVRYLVVHLDPMARPDLHDAAVRAIKAAFPPAAEGGGVRVYALW
jgi:hypothetical protein